MERRTNSLVKMKSSVMIGFYPIFIRHKSMKQEAQELYPWVAHYIDRCFI